MAKRSARCSPTRTVALATAYSADEDASLRAAGDHACRWNFLRAALARGDAYADLGGVDVAGRRLPQPGESTYGLYEHKHSLGAVWTDPSPPTKSCSDLSGKSAASW